MLSSSMAEDLGGSVLYVVLSVLISMAVFGLRVWWVRRHMPSPESRRAAVGEVRKMQASGAGHKECMEYLRQMGYNEVIADMMVGEAMGKAKR